MKKIISVLICIAFILPVVALSSCALENVSFEQILPIIPKISTVIKLNSSTGETVNKSDCYAKFGNNSLEITGLEKYDAGKHNSIVYFVVDCSSSVSAAYLNAIKIKLNEYSNKLSDNEKMVLVSFGSKIRTVLNGGEDQSIRYSRINALSADQSQTDLYDAIKYVVEKSQNDVTAETDRSFAVLMSDGENYDNDGGNTKQEALDLVSGHGLPIYSMCLSATSENASNVGSLSRKSGGEIYTVTRPADVGKTFDNLIDNSNNVFILSMRTKTNIEYNGTAMPLQLRVKNKSTSVDAKPTRWIKDDDAPYITDVKTVDEDDGTVAVYIYYSENVLNANKPENFIISRKSETDKLIIDKAEYVMTDDEYYSVLTLEKDPPQKDDYKITLKNITDSSNEQNQIKSENEKYEIGIRNSFVVFLSQYWYVFIIILILGGAVFAVIFIVRNLSKNQKKETTNIVYANAVNEVVEKHHIVTPRGRSITLSINGSGTSVRTVKTHVGEKLVVGRSEKCDVYLDDPKMSRFHFKITSSGNELWIEDLNSVNGTKVNNSEIHGKFKLSGNDTVIAGQTKIVINF